MPLRWRARSSKHPGKLPCERSPTSSRPPGSPSARSQISNAQARLASAALAEFERLEMPFWRDRAANLRDAIEQKLGPASYPAGLTEREMEVLRLAVQGHSDKEISDLLFISPRTVNAHMRNMFAKTSSANRTDLSVWAVGQGLVTR